MKTRLFYFIFLFTKLNEHVPYITGNYADLASKVKLRFNRFK